MPAVAANDASRWTVAVRQDHRGLPAGAQPSGTMPAFTWANGVGTATLGHLPAFVRLPSTPGVAAPGISPG